MERKYATGAVKWTEKNRTYLKRLGLIDGRSGGSRSNSNISQFINECVTICLESCMHPRAALAGKKELELAWIKKQHIMLNIQQEEIEHARFALMQHQKRIHESDAETSISIKTEASEELE